MPSKRAAWASIPMLEGKAWRMWGEKPFQTAPLSVEREGHLTVSVWAIAVTLPGSPAKVPQLWGHPAPLVPAERETGRQVGVPQIIAELRVSLGN